MVLQSLLLPESAEELYQKAASTSEKHKGAAELNSIHAEPTGSTKRKRVVPKEEPTGEKPSGNAESDGPIERR